ncbi:uncharacterized protein LOC144625731 [Crassostrea virginica]
MCQLLGIKKTRTTPYHPKSDGMVERFNKTLASMLRVYVGDHQQDWDTHLPYLMMGYRSVEHETTGSTPNALMLGREVATPIDIMYQKPSGLVHVPQNRWAWELKEKLQEVHRAVQEHVHGKMQRQKRYHDAKLNWEKFIQGYQTLSDEVLQEKVSSKEVADEESECQEIEDTITNCPDSG